MLEIIKKLSELPDGEYPESIVQLIIESNILLERLEQCIY